MVSGPVSTVDVDPAGPNLSAAGPVLEISTSRNTEVGEFPVRRALPGRRRRSVGPWCFVDHIGPAAISVERGLGVAPHPHIGLHTVTWLSSGAALHRDSLGSEQIIRPGQLNLMTAGHGVSHSEEGTGRFDGTLHGVQLWVAQPSTTRNGPPGFEHHPELPVVELGGQAEARVLLGSFFGATSPGRRDDDLVGADLVLGPGTDVIPLEAGFEHAAVMVDGSVLVEGQVLEPGHLGYLGVGRDELGVSALAPARMLLLGGPPFEEPLVMWWNLVARTTEEITAAYQDWVVGAERFGRVASSLARMEVGPPPWVG